VELRNEYLVLAREKQRASAIGNVSFCQGRAAFLTDKPFDCVVSSYLAKYADIPRLADAAVAWLKPGGRFVAHDFTLPPDPVLLAIWKIYLLALQTIAGPWLPAWKEIFYGLPKLLHQTQWLDELPDELRQREFLDINIRYLTFYGSALVTAKRPS
jgi:demethylmenaquinone methyltransferase / 2-methoxy-6-polyprenyl-1,4-benzoquinol methylase